MSAIRNVPGNYTQTSSNSAALPALAGWRAHGRSAGYIQRDR